MHYAIVGNYLSVMGDTGDAIYAWQQRITWQFLANCELDYFHGKCVASETGRDFDQWDARKLIDSIEWHTQNEVPTSKKTIDEIKSIARGTTSSQEWLEVARDYPRIFPEPMYDYADFGKTIHVRCVGHWVGIQMAMGHKDRLLQKYKE